MKLIIYIFICVAIFSRQCKGCAYTCSICTAEITDGIPDDICSEGEDLPVIYCEVGSQVCEILTNIIVDGDDFKDNTTLRFKMSVERRCVSVDENRYNDIRLNKKIIDSDGYLVRSDVPQLKILRADDRVEKRTFITRTQCVPVRKQFVQGISNKYANRCNEKMKITLGYVYQTVFEKLPVCSSCSHDSMYTAIPTKVDKSSEQNRCIYGDRGFNINKMVLCNGLCFIKIKIYLSKTKVIGIERGCTTKAIFSGFKYSSNGAKLRKGEKERIGELNMSPIDSYQHEIIVPDPKFAELWSFCEHTENRNVITMNYSTSVTGWGSICNGKMAVLRNDELNTAIIENHNARVTAEELHRKQREEQNSIGHARQRHCMVCSQTVVVQETFQYSPITEAGFENILEKQANDPCFSGKSYETYYTKMCSTYCIVGVYSKIINGTGNIKNREISVNRDCMGNSPKVEAHKKIHPSSFMNMNHYNNSNICWGTAENELFCMRVCNMTNCNKYKLVYSDLYVLHHHDGNSLWGVDLELKNVNKNSRCFTCSNMEQGQRTNEVGRKRVIDESQVFSPLSSKYCFSKHTMNNTMMCDSLCATFIRVKRKESLVVGDTEYHDRTMQIIRSCGKGRLDTGFQGDIEDKFKLKSMNAAKSNKDKEYNDPMCLGNNKELDCFFSCTTSDCNFNTPVEVLNDINVWFAKHENNAKPKKMTVVTPNGSIIYGNSSDNITDAKSLMGSSKNSALTILIVLLSILSSAVTLGAISMMYVQKVERESNMMQDLYGAGYMGKQQDSEMELPLRQTASLNGDRPFVDYCMDDGDVVRPIDLLLGNALLGNVKQDTDTEPATTTNDEEEEEEEASSSASSSDNSSASDSGSNSDSDSDSDASDSDSD